MLYNMEVVQDYIQTEIGLLPSDWGIKTLGDLAFVVGGGTPQTNVNSYWNGNINWFTPTEVGLKKYSYSSIRKITIQGLENCSARILPIGTILLTTRAGIGDVTILMSEASTNQGFQSFVANKNTNNEYLYYLISTLKKELLKNSSGSTFLEISPNKLKSIVVRVPSTLEEQTIIATTLSNTDTWITNLENLLTKKRQIKQAALQELLKPKQGWANKTIRQVAKYRRGSFPQPYGLDKWYDDYNGMPFVQVYDVDDNKKLKSDTKRKISIEGAKFSVFVEKGSVILTIQGSIGRIAITQYDAYVDRTLLIFESFSVPFDKYFFVAIIFLLFEKEKEKAPGGIIKTITKEALSSFEISYPSIKEQTRIATILSDMDLEIERLETKLQKAKKVKQGMMQELLTGKTRLV